MHKGAQGRPVNYLQADHSCANYLRKIDLFYSGADSIILNWFNEVFYKFRYYSIYYLAYSNIPLQYSDQHCMGSSFKTMEVLLKIE